MKHAFHTKKNALRLLCAALVLLTGLLSGCEKQALPALSLVDELPTDTLELRSLPWQSDAALALERFQLADNRYSVREINWTNGQGPWGLQIGFPVHWEDMDCDASLLLTYRYDDSQTADGVPGTELCRVGLTLYFPDDAARDACVQNAAAMLKALADKDPSYPLPDRWKFDNERGETAFTADDLYTLSTGIRLEGLTCELRTRRLYNTGIPGCSEGLRLILSATPDNELRPEPGSPYGVVSWD